jgi:hypothetical protein
VSWDEAKRLTGGDLFDAEEWIIGPKRGGTPLHLRRRLTPSLARRLRFVSSAGPKAPCFVSPDKLDNQTTRGIRELTAKSAALFDRIIDVTDARSDQIVTVSEEMLGSA